ncbi:hypothetical protein MRX96_002494 [Rhipicephalus microplus]
MYGKYCFLDKSIECVKLLNSSARPCSGAVPPVTFSPLPLRTRSAQEPPCISGWGGLWKRTVPCGSLDWLLECDGPLDWDRRRSLDRDLARPLDEVPFRWPWERLLDRDLDLDRLLACCDESRLSTPVAAERLFELELRCAGWLTPSSALAALKLPLAFSPHAVARSVALAFVRLELFFTAAERQPCSSPNSSGGSSSPSIITAAPSSILAQQVERRARPWKGASCPADANSAFVIAVVVVIIGILFKHKDATTTAPCATASATSARAVSTTEASGDRVRTVTEASTSWTEAPSVSSVEVNTTSGILKGGAADVYGVALYRWLGVPYSRLGARSKRFAFAQLVKASSLLALDSKAASLPCAQVINDTLLGREDCLRVNV